MGVWKIVTASALAVAAGFASLSVASGQESDIQIVGLDCSGDPEVVVIENVGEEAVDLTGWQLLSAPPESQMFDLFTIGKLGPGERIFIQSGTAAGGLHKWATEFVFRDGDPSDYARIVDDSGAIVQEVNCVDALALPPVIVPNGGGPPPVDGSPPLWMVLVGGLMAAAGLVTLAFSRLRASIPWRGERTGDVAPLPTVVGRPRQVESGRAGRLPVLLTFALSMIVLLLAVSLLWWARGGVRG